MTSWISLIAALLALPGCAAYTLRVAPAPAIAVPETLHGVSCGPAVTRELTRAGWAPAEAMGDGQIYVLAAPEPGVNAVELGFAPAGEGRGTIRFVRVQYPNGRLATYQALLRKLLDAHGPPQSSEERLRSAHFVPPSDGERPRAPRYVVHEWRGERSVLVLVAGLESPENLASAMDYQLVLLPAGVASGATSLADAPAPLARPTENP
jgi:hypothetical protein